MEYEKRDGRMTTIQTQLEKLKSARQFWIDTVSTDFAYKKAYMNAQDGEEKSIGHVVHTIMAFQKLWLG